MKISTLFASALMLTVPGMAGAETVAVTATPAQTVARGLSSSGVRRTVLAQTRVAPDTYRRLVKDEHGRVFYDIVRQGRVSAAPQRITVPMRAPQNASFFEDFESHAGQLDWLPEGWTEINTPENKTTQEMCSHNINNSWAAQDTGDGYWTAITSDGVKECWIHFTYSWSYVNGEGETIKGEAAPQDEWLITPEITVQDGHDLFFLGELDLGAVFNFDWNEMAYDRSNVECDLEVLATVDDGANWTSLWKASSDVCSKMTDDEMYDVMAELAYDNYTVDLKDFYGKTVKLAFRYTNIGGIAGNSAAVDAVTVCAPAAEAAYGLPDGNLLVGMSDGLSVRSQSEALMPAYTDIQWTAGSNMYTSSNSWTFYDAEGDERGTFTGADVTISYPYSAGKTVPWPLLTASNKAGSDTFSYDGKDANKGGIYFGGSLPPLTFEGYDGVETLYLGNFDYQHKRMTVTNLGGEDYVYGTHGADAWGTGITQVKFGNLFLAPPAPLVVTDVLLTLGEFDADDDAEFTLEIHRVSASGDIDATPAVTAKVKGADIDGFGFYPVKFVLDEPFVMDGMTIMFVSGFANNPKVRSFAACAQALGNDAAHNYAYMMFDINGSLQLYSAAQALEDYSSALCLGLNGTYHFLSLADEMDQIIDLDSETNSRQVAAIASNAPTEWWIVDGEDKLPLVAEGTAYDWLTVKPYTAEDGSHSIVFSAEPTDKNRAKTVRVANHGGQIQMRVRQSATDGIRAVETEINDGPVQYFNLQGVAVPGADLVPGVYIRRQGTRVSKVTVR